MADDWFAASAPAKQADWFAANAPKSVTAEPPSFGQRVVEAVGPAVRGLGDLGVPFTNLDINHGLEASGLVAPGRLTGPEQNERNRETRVVSGIAGGGAISGQLLSRFNSAIGASRAAAASEAADRTNAAARAARTARFAETGVIDASPEVVTAPAETSAPVTGALLSKGLRTLVKLGLLGAGAKAAAHYLD